MTILAIDHQSSVEMWRRGQRILVYESRSTIVRTWTKLPTILAPVESSGK